MKRRLFTILSALSLLLCLAAIFLWVRSYRNIDHVSLASNRLYRAVSGGGGIFLESLRVFRHKRTWPNRIPTTVEISILNYAEWNDQHPYPHLRPPTKELWWETGAYSRSSLLVHAWGPDLNLALPHVTKLRRAQQNIWNNADGSSFHDSLYGPRVWIPYWVIVVLTAALPARHILTHIRQSRRRAQNHCPTCGYDLRATPDQCPECGATTAKPPT